MRWLLCGALLGLLLASHPIGALVVAVAVAVVLMTFQPPILAFLLGMVARPYLVPEGRAMNDKISNAAREAANEALEAADNSRHLELVAAVLKAQQLTQAQQPCQHQAPQPFDARKWLVIGGLLIAGGLVASIFAIAVAVGSVSASILALVVRSMWRDVRK